MTFFIEALTYRSYNLEDGLHGQLKLWSPLS